MFPNIISRDGVRHDVMPPVNTTWSVEKAAPSGGKNLGFVILRREWLSRARLCHFFRTRKINPGLICIYHQILFRLAYMKDVNICYRIGDAVSPIKHNRLRLPVKNIFPASEALITPF
jgi:hypothetical protein